MDKDNLTMTFLKCLIFPRILFKRAAILIKLMTIIFSEISSPRAPEPPFRLKNWTTET